MFFCSLNRSPHNSWAADVFRQSCFGLLVVHHCPQECALSNPPTERMPQFLHAFCFALSLYRERTENDRDIKIFYYCHEGFSMNFHVFIHKNHACLISLHRRTWRAENCGGSLRYCTPRMASVVILYCSVTRANHSPEPSSVPARRTSVSS